jgi:molecular chaperone GrpE (heat shock protein)
MTTIKTISFSPYDVQNYLQGKNNNSLKRFENEYVSYARQTVQLVDYLDQWELVVETENEKKRLGNFRREIMRAMLHHGIRPTACAGTQVDLALHEIVSISPCDDVKKGTITEVLQMGYEMRRQGYEATVLRVAKVIVSD